MLGQNFSKMEAAFAVVMLAMLVPNYIQKKQMPDAKDIMVLMIIYKMGILASLAQQILSKQKE